MTARKLGSPNPPTPTDVPPADNPTHSSGVRSVVRGKVRPHSLLQRTPWLLPLGLAFFGSFLALLALSLLPLSEWQGIALVLIIFSGCVSTWLVTRWQTTRLLHELTAELETMPTPVLSRTTESQPETPANASTAPSLHPPTFLDERERSLMVARLTPKLLWQSATPQLLQLINQSPAILPQDSFLSIVLEEDRAGVEQALHEALRKGEYHNLVFRLNSTTATIGAPKSAIHLQMDVLVYFDADNHPVQLRCHLLDLTERILADDALRRRSKELAEINDRLERSNRDLERLKESYRDLYHNAPIMYFSLDEEGRFAAVNETLLRNLGYRREQLMGQPYALLLSPSQLARESERGLPQPSSNNETQWIGADGRLRDVWVGVTTIADTDGRTVRTRCAAADLTERNQLARAVAQRARDLEKANAQLRRTNQQLEEFTYVVSHDLKEPLRTLEAFSQFLATDCSPQLSGEGMEYINHLTQASRRLGTLIEDLLTLSRAGRVINTPRPLDWTTLLSTLQADLQLQINRQPRAILRIEGPLPPAQGDPERVMQLLTNLVSNALKYNQSEPAEVVIGSIPGEESGMVTLFVRDNGLGIDPRYHEQIFRIFRRLHTRDQFEGTGAGLAICKKIIEAHGGRLWVESAVGQGSTFYFTLPQGAAPPSLVSPEPLAPSTASRSRDHEPTP